MDSIHEIKNDKHLVTLSLEGLIAILFSWHCPAASRSRLKTDRILSTGRSSPIFEGYRYLFLPKKFKTKPNPKVTGICYVFVKWLTKHTERELECDSMQSWLMLVQIFPTLGQTDTIAQCGRSGFGSEDPNKFARSEDSYKFSIFADPYQYQYQLARSNSVNELFS